jgi:uncharacterized protein with gpF-like domain
MNKWSEARVKAQQRWAQVRRSEAQYRRQLRGVADQVGMLVKGFAPDGVLSASAGKQLADALRRYAITIEPWARNVTEKMHLTVERHDGDAWIETARSLGRELRRELRETDTGAIVRQLTDRQVSLITSLPLEAAQRVYELAQRQVLGGSRGEDLRKMILASGHVTRSRADLIAYDAVATTQSSITEARAVQLGSPGYIWRSMRDQDVRPAVGIKHFAELNTLAKGSHRKLNGTFHRWDDPPIAGTRGERAHPGRIYRCRCYPDPVLDEERFEERIA